jgi:hypothetical protein
MKKNPTDQFHSNHPQKDTAPFLDDDFSAVENFPLKSSYYGTTEKPSFYAKVADFCSSWKFIALMSSILLLWIIFSLILWYRQ